jgi:hypothetical protein
MTFEDQLLADLNNNQFNTGEFAKVGSYTPTGGIATPVDIQFWNEYQASRLLDIQDDALGPYALGKTSDFPSAKKNETLVIDGTTYYIDPRPGGTGVTRLILSKVAHG